MYVFFCNVQLAALYNKVKYRLGSVGYFTGQNYSLLHLCLLFQTNILRYVFIILYKIKQTLRSFVIKIVV